MININKRNSINNSSGVRRLFTLSLLSIAISGCGGGGDSGGAPTPPTNLPPVLSDIAPLLVSAGDAVTISANATDPEGDSITFSWQQLNGDAVSNSQGFDSSTANFNALDLVNTLMFRVTASAQGGSDTKDVRVVIVEDTNAAIFVDADFTGTADGSIDAPFTSLNDAMHDGTTFNDFYVKTPNNDASYLLFDTRGRKNLSKGQSIYGGYNSNWEPDAANNKTPISIVDERGIIYIGVTSASTTVSGLALSVTVQDTALSPDTLLGLGIGGTGGKFTIANNNIDVKYESDPSTQVINSDIYSVYVAGHDELIVHDNTFTTGYALSSLNQITRTSGEGADGNDGEDGRVGNNETGGAGGSGTGGWNGGTGGNAGESRNENGFAGNVGGGRTSAPFIEGGFGGSGGQAGDTPNGGNAGNGDPGERGNGGDGGNGYGGISFFTGAYQSTTGSVGSDGYSGAGGGGGGGGAASGAGNNGGAGGGGGEGGDGGSPGFVADGGGASIGLHIAGGTTNEIRNNTISSGNGGIGGVGSSGSRGGEGGEGGIGDPGNLTGGEGGDGGDGGSGGVGGVGGSGGGGASFAIFIGGDTPAIIESNRLTSGKGGLGGNANLNNEPQSAGEGGWSYAIFDGNTADNFVISVADNEFVVGEGGADGLPKTGTGEASETNF